MDYSLESNERTLVMFDSICSGLSSCLALVHADIRQMTEHRNRLAQLEQSQIRAKCRSAHDLYHNDLGAAAAAKHRKSSRPQSGVPAKDDSNYLNGLKLLDKRLAESFNQAFQLNEEQKWSIAAKHQASQSKPSIFQVLLGKTIHRKLSQANQNLTSPTKQQQQQLQDEDDLSNATNERADNKMIIDDINKQIRLAMQYIKQLEAHLLRVEDLRPKYEMHLKMGLVVRSSSNNSNNGNSLNRFHDHHHQSLSSLKSSKSKNSSYSSSTNVNNNPTKTTIKEFIENISRIEEEFESYMGSFLLAVEDIQGFARVCQGDVFEITIKYGLTQKFKTKISVLKDNKQKCDNRQIVFKAKINDILAIKAYECKGLGKRVLLGHKLCETRDLFTAQSQLMTISLNQTGSIKLNLIVTWNPLHMAPASASTLATSPGLDISHISLPPTPISSSTLSSVCSSAPSINGAPINVTNGTTTTINIKSPSKSSRSPLGSDYQTIDSTYGYYIPPPDYVSNDGV